MIPAQRIVNQQGAPWGFLRWGDRGLFGDRTGFTATRFQAAAWLFHLAPRVGVRLGHADFAEFWKACRAPGAVRVNLPWVGFQSEADPDHYLVFDLHGYLISLGIAQDSMVAR